MDTTYIINFIIYFVMFGLSYYAISGLDLGKLCLPGKNRSFKAQHLLVLMALALGYLTGQFFIAIMYPN